VTHELQAVARRWEMQMVLAAALAEVLEDEVFERARAHAERFTNSTREETR